jgi:hypothetical protein
MWVYNATFDLVMNHEDVEIKKRSNKLEPHLSSLAEPPARIENLQMSSKQILRLFNIATENGSFIDDINPHLP